MLHESAPVLLSSSGYPSPMDLLPITFASGVASGINAYATVLLLGLYGRFGGADVPAGLQRTDVLIVMGILTVIELVADKIPYVDSVWDTVSTIVRPLAGAAIGALMAGANGDILTVTLAAVGGITALMSHVVRAAIRLAINTSPEPVTNVGHSLAGDATVAGIATLAAFVPIVAAVVAGIVLLIGMLVAWKTTSRVRSGYVRFRTWLRTRKGSA